MAVEAVVFDIGNVLIEWQPERFYDSVIGAERRKEMFANVDLHGMNEQVDLGADFRETIYAMAEATPAYGDDIRMWHDNWIEMASPQIPHSVKLLRALRSKGVPVFALTNFGIGTFEVALARYPFLAEFDRAFVSGHMGLIKPDPRIYEALEADCALPPQALLFTDDRAENIRAAQGRGWQTHLFVSPVGWAQKLIGAGLLTEEEAAP